MPEIKEGLEKLREPFAPNQIGQKPKGGVMLDFVGHAALTDRLLDVDPEWNWEPFAVGEDGLPKFDAYGGLWIRLTICGVTRIGYGDGEGKKSADAVKIAIGDALRNSGMRYGAALDLWHKGDLHEAEPDPVEIARGLVIDLLRAKEIKPDAAAALFTEFGGKGKISECGDAELLERFRAHVAGL